MTEMKSQFSTEIAKKQKTKQNKNKNKTKNTAS